ncbi:MAG: alkaline phosphatase family protein [Nitrospinota bacterium]|nr:alkaline phosphatase family protein [Nitrospinota bacterium]HJM42607.1 alkaline phosphatase family protein [Nitrospinota bacterium]
MSSRKVLIIGVDAGTLDLIEPWAAAGRLPNISRLIARGAFGVARSTVPPSTYPAWTTFMTGVGPGRHGLADFLIREPGKYALRFAGARDRGEGAPSLWSLLSRTGRRVAVIGMPATHPPERLNGVMVSGFDSPLAYRWDRGFVLPVSYFEEITRAVGPYRFSACGEDHVDEGWHDRAKGEILDSLEQQTRVAEYILGREDWDLFAMVFGQTDTACHHFWMFHDPASPRFSGRDSPEAARHGGFIGEVYRRVDASIGRLIKTGPRDASVLLVSDHGAGGAGNGVVRLNRWLEREGWLTFRNFTVRDRALRRVRRFGLSHVPRGLKQSVFRRRGRELAGAIESRIRFGGIDFARTAAFSEEMSSFPGVWANLRGRDPEGILPPGEYEPLRDNIIRSAESLRDPRTGERIFNRAARREEVYSGPYVDRFPDVVLEPALERDPHPNEAASAQGYSYSFLTSGEGPGDDGGETSWFRELRPDERAGARGRGMNGTHRPEGFFVFSGPGVRPGRYEPGADLADFAPTLMAHLGERPAVSMEGRVLSALLDAPGPSSEPSPPKPPVRNADLTSVTMGAGGPDWEMETAERLRDLGYLE